MNGEHVSNSRVMLEITKVGGRAISAKPVLVGAAYQLSIRRSGTIWITEAGRDDRRCFIVWADGELTPFLEVETE